VRTNNITRNGRKFSAPTITAIAASFALSTAFAANIPKNCTDEIVALSKGSGFDMQKFTSDLPAAVVKAKAQAKLPFGKPKDSDKTDIGMTFGCLKSFPESPGEIQSLLKDVSLEMAKGAVASQLGTGQEALQQAQYQPPQQVQPQPEQQPYYPSQQQANPQYQYQPQQAQPQYQYQQQQPQYQYPPLLVQCKQDKVICECSQQPAAKNYAPQAGRTENFTGGQRFATWLLNTFIPIGAGSALIMQDYIGMGIQIGLNALGTISMTALGFEERCDSYSGYYGSSYNDCYTETTAFFPIGIGLLSASAIYNIFRSATYDEPIENIASRGYSGFNLAVLPNKYGRLNTYLMYNKVF
jgi:hypothetical protein